MAKLSRNLAATAAASLIALRLVSADALAQYTNNTPDAITVEAETNRVADQKQTAHSESERIDMVCRRIVAAELEHFEPKGTHGKESDKLMFKDNGILYELYVSIADIKHGGSAGDHIWPNYLLNQETLRFEDIRYRVDISGGLNQHTTMNRAYYVADTGELLYTTASDESIVEENHHQLTQQAMDRLADRAYKKILADTKKQGPKEIFDGSVYTVLVGNNQLFELIISQNPQGAPKLLDGEGISKVTGVVFLNYSEGDGCEINVDIDGESTTKQYVVTKDGLVPLAQPYYADRSPDE